MKIGDILNIEPTMEGDQRAGHCRVDPGAGDLHPPGGAVLHGGVLQFHYRRAVAGGLLA